MEAERVNGERVYKITCVYNATSGTMRTLPRPHLHEPQGLRREKEATTSGLLLSVLE